ncbi:hypothetical protein Hypma_002207 [Hypsizygus marmoreus]|uniref:Uncharacterized protein n=1 Tax=Hypsizygus marmoreus TaxID=39966 RepID=A0A369K368_HYPMA|nr:hypothetical protein Hypma_002207 [Hypsizygus marmoreus]
MAPFTLSFLVISLAACQLGVQAAPVGNLKCNLAAINTVTNLSAANKAVDSLADIAINADDAALANALTDAQLGLDDADSAVQDIAAALRAKQPASTALRDKAIGGLTQAKTALDAIQGASGAAASPLKEAKAKVAAALAAGQQVVANCAAEADATQVSNAAATPAEPNAAADASQETNTNNLKAATKTEKRQIGNLRCNINRLQTVGNLAKSNKAVAKLATASASDSIAADAAQTAKDGLAGAKAGIATIAKDLLTGQKASAEARTQTLDGLNQAKTALAGITSTDAAVTAAVADAQQKVDATLAAGGNVVANCK